MAALVLLASSSCGGDSPAVDSGALVDASRPSPDLAAPLALANIHVTVRYAGTQVGKLGVGAFRSFPPTAGPLAYQRNATPSFPANVQLTGLEPGQVYVVVTLDLPPDSPQAPGPEDLVAVSMPITLAGKDVTTEVTLHDHGDGGTH